MNVHEASDRVCPVLGLDGHSSTHHCYGERCMGWAWTLPGDTSSDDGYCKLIDLPPSLTLSPAVD